ncbi:MAG: polymerase sigma-70 factor, subfamily [Solirubrobacterales bacterium]|nr:polymerase sigma-70 factor, subfamily [Solirubrobacterales bacterium]
MVVTSFEANTRAEVRGRDSSLPHVAFVERIEASAEHVEDLDTARLVTRFQAGDSGAFTELYRRYFDRVYGYLRVLLKQTRDAEDAAQQVMLQVLEALPRYERRAQPFRAWLFTIVRNYGIQQAQRQGRVDLVDPATLDRRRDGVAPDAELHALDWVSDKDLLLFIERLPAAQRQVLVLRFMMGLSSAEIARVLDRNPDSVRRAQSRALSFLRRRLTAVGRESSRGDLAGARGYLRQARVVRARRFALLHSGPIR